MFKIKICGITSISDGLAAARSGADAIGLNFYAKSPRYVSRQLAREIAEAMPPGVVKVGLFVDTPAEDVCRLFDELPLDLIQLHGDQPPEFIAQLGHRPVMRAFRVGGEGPQAVEEYLARCRELSARPVLVLLDAFVPGEYGGTGKTANWEAAREYTEKKGVPPLVLAGGLTPENVAEAIRTVRPAAVDTASGVEVRPGQKSVEAIERFVQAARAGFGLARPLSLWERGL